VTRFLLVLAFAAACGSAPPPAYRPSGTPPPGAAKEDPPASLQKLAVGTPAPAIALPDTTGATWSLETALARSQKVVVVFYRGEWCLFCRSQLGELQAASEDFAAQGAELVAVSVDSPALSAKLVAGLGLRYPVLSDVGRESIRAYGVDDAENQLAWPAIVAVQRTSSGPQIAWVWTADKQRERIPATEVVAALEALR
jgi:peroxiredoxin